MNSGDPLRPHSSFLLIRLTDITASIWRASRRLYQLQSFQARMPVPADDNVIVDLDTEAARDLDNSFRHLNVGARRCRIASDYEPHLVCGDLAVFF